MREFVSMHHTDNNIYGAGTLLTGTGY